MERPTQHKYPRHENGWFTAEPGECFVGLQNSSGIECHDDHYRNHIGADPLGDSEQPAQRSEWRKTKAVDASDLLAQRFSRTRSSVEGKQTTTRALIELIVRGLRSQVTTSSELHAKCIL